MTYSIKVAYETKVHVLTYKPTAATIAALIGEHNRSVDTELTEWEIDIDRIANEPIHNMGVPGNRYRWEVTLTRRIK